MNPQADLPEKAGAADASAAKLPKVEQIHRQNH